MTAGQGITILAADAAGPDARLLLDALSAALLRINGESGRSSFDVEAATPRAVLYCPRRRR